MSSAIVTLSNIFTRTRKTIGAADLSVLRREIRIGQQAGRYQVNYPFNSVADPHRKYKEIARYLLVARLIEGGRVLDLGSGSFYGAAILAEKADQVVGIEKSRGAVLRAKVAWRRVRNLQCRQGAELTGAMGIFNAVTVINVIEHMPEDMALHLLKQAKEHLAEEGVIILATPRRRSQFTGQPENPDHVREYDEQELENLVGETGLRVEERYIQTMTEIKPGRQKDVSPRGRAWFLFRIINKNQKSLLKI